MMGGRRRTEEHAMCSCFSLLLQSRTFCERADISMISTPWSAVRTSNSPASGIHLECGHCYVCWLTGAHTLKNVSLNIAVYIWSWNVEDWISLGKMTSWQNTCIDKQRMHWEVGRSGNTLQLRISGLKFFRNRHFCHSIWTMFCISFERSWVVTVWNALLW